MRGIVLAGGAGTRMDGPKMLAPLAGRPLVDYPARALAAAGLPVAVVAKRETELPLALFGEDVEVVREPDDPRHALLGIVTALERFGEPIVVCAGDMPFAGGKLLKWIAELDGAPIAVPAHAGRLEPLIGRYSPDALPQLRNAVAHEMSAQRAVREAHAREITVEELAEFGDPERLLFDVDTPEDLARAREWLGARA